MKQVRFLATSFATSMLMLLSSCNSGDDKKTEETTTFSFGNNNEGKSSPRPSQVNKFQFQL